MLSVSTLPNTPGRGRSRFSKMLPTPPADQSPRRSPVSPLSPLNSPLPPLPQEKLSLRDVSRRQVPKHRRRSMSSNSSYDSPRRRRSLSESSDNNEKDSLSGVDSEAGPTPPLPPKNNENVQKVDLPETPINPLSKAATNFNPSPPRTELWRRRSQRSDRSINVTGLRLEKSNGSTASPPNRQEPPSAHNRQNLPRSVTGRKPVPARPAPPQPGLMGNKLGKLKDKGSDDSSPEHHEVPHQYTSFQRLPTPEYLKSENINPHTKPSAPVSPLTPQDDKPPEVPRKSESRGTSSAAASKSSESTVRPTIFSPHSRQPSETLTITSEPAVRSPQPQKPVSATLLTPQQSPSHRRSPSLATDFPALPSPADDWTIFPGPPLEMVHFECYQNHKYMRSSRNTSCPVGCMVCQKLDTEMRWRCTWCCLSACAPCMQVLTSIPGKDLRVCLGEIGK